MASVVLCKYLTMRNQMRLMKRYLMGLVSSKSEGKSGCGMASSSVLMPFTIT
jgi:hypothetical protein